MIGGIVLADTPEGAFEYGLRGVLIVAVALMVAGMAIQVWVHRITSAMRDLRLIMNTEGITYTSSAGTYSAPWSEVQGVKLRGRPSGFNTRATHLVIHAPGLNGPVSKWPMFHRLTLRPAETGVDAEQAAQAARELSNDACRVS